MGVETFPYSLILPSLGLDGAQPGNLYDGAVGNGAPASSLAPIIATGFEEAGAGIFNVTFSGYEAGQASLIGGQTVDGIAMLAADGHFGAVMQTLVFSPEQAAPAAVDPTEVRSIQGCGVTYTDNATVEGVFKVTFGLNTSCTIQATEVLLSALDGTNTSAAIATDRAAANTNYQATINAYVAQI